MWWAGLDEEEYVRVDGKRMYQSKKSAPIFHTTFAPGRARQRFVYHSSKIRSVATHRRRPWSRLQPADRNLVSTSPLRQREASAYNGFTVAGVTADGRLAARSGLVCRLCRRPGAMDYRGSCVAGMPHLTVTSHGPVNPKRVEELQSTLKDCTATRVYVSAFPDFRQFKQHVDKIAWETEVWLAEIPDHLIHSNGDKFLGPKADL